MITKIDITGDRGSGKTTTMAYHLAQWLRENPKGVALVVTANPALKSHFLDVLVHTVNIAPRDIKRVDILHPNSMVGCGRNAQAVYIDNAELISKEVKVSVLAMLQPTQPNDQTRYLYVTSRTGEVDAF